MGKKFLFLVFLLLGVFISSTPALAYNQQLTIYATVPPLRAIYVDAYGNIIKIGGNTSENIPPTVYDQKNQPVAMTSTIQDQYQQFLLMHGGRLQASKIYDVNPLTISLAPNTQKIMVNSPSLTLDSPRIN